MNRLTAVVGMLVAAGAAFGQLPAGWMISVDYGPGQTALWPGNPSCTVRVSGWFSPPDHALAGGVLRVAAWEEGWSDNRGLPPMLVGANPGTIEGRTVNDIIGGQLHFPPSWNADPRNPIPFWEATWSTTSFRVRQIPVTTVTSRFWVYPSGLSPRSESRLAGLMEGQAQILIVPAPPAALLLAGGAFLRRNRRRTFWSGVTR